jgi:hypothetical protein
MDWRRLDERIEGLSAEIEAVAAADTGCERLMSVPGLGPIIASATVAAIGTGEVFSKGRDFAAWLGLVLTCTGGRLPEQHQKRAREGMHPGGQLDPALPLEVSWILPCLCKQGSTSALKRRSAACAQAFMAGLCKQGATSALKRRSAACAQAFMGRDG